MTIGNKVVVSSAVQSKTVPLGDETTFPPDVSSEWLIDWYYITVNMKNKELSSFGNSLMTF